MIDKASNCESLALYPGVEHVNGHMNFLIFWYIKGIKNREV